MKLGFEKFDGDQSAKMEYHAREEFINEVQNHVQRFQKEVPNGNKIIQGIALGPDEYLGVMAALWRRDLKHATPTSPPEKIQFLLGYPVYLKDGPGIDLLCEPNIHGAMVMSDKFKYLKVKK